MDKLIRCITSDGSVMAIAAETSDIVFTAKKLHHTSPAATAALGRLLTAASLMGSCMKSEDASITLRINGDGPLGSVIAVSDNGGNPRGYVMNPVVDTEYYSNGKINVSAAVGKNGILNVMKDFGHGDPYFGQVELVSGEIAEDITSYYAASEQIPTVCVLGVLLNKEDGEVMLSGGMLVQLLPGAYEDTVDKLEKALSTLEPVTTMLAKGYSPEQMVREFLKDFEVEVLDETPIKYKCTCSREKISNLISTFPDEEIRSLADENGFAKANCHFCNKNYHFSKKQLEDIIKSRDSKKE